MKRNLAEPKLRKELEVQILDANDQKQTLRNYLKESKHPLFIQSAKASTQFQSNRIQPSTIYQSLYRNNQPSHPLHHRVDMQPSSSSHLIGCLGSQGKHETKNPNYPLRRSVGGERVAKLFQRPPKDQEITNEEPINTSFDNEEFNEDEDEENHLMQKMSIYCRKLK